MQKIGLVSLSPDSKSASGIVSLSLFLSLCLSLSLSLSL